MIDCIPIDGYPGYFASSEGKIYSETSGKELKQMFKKGYMQVCLYNNKIQTWELVHRLIASAFLQNEDGKPEVNHKDGNTLNNAEQNLEWCTRDENLRHAYETGLSPFDTSSKGVVCWKKEEPSKRFFFHSIYRAAREMNISQGNICMVCRGQRPLASGYVFRYSN